MSSAHLAAAAAARQWPGQEMTESLVEEVQVFIGTLYAQLGIFLYVIVAAAVLGFIVYAYLKAS